VTLVPLSIIPLLSSVYIIIHIEITCSLYFLCEVGRRANEIQSMISSETLQSSKLPSGRYRRMIRGIFRCDNSLIAI
jgi:hypothetical protein